MSVTLSVFNRETDRTLDGGEKGIPPTPSTSIRKVIRPMRGGSQSHLVLCDDGHHYVCKFCGNPQGNRTLINEIIASRLAMHLDLATPPVSLLNMPEALQQTTDIHFKIGSRRVPPQEGPHFGSQFPVNPDKIWILDFLPATWSQKISNIDDFATMFVMDRWLYQTDIRQAVFIRDRHLRDKVAFKCYFIDHGMILSGSRWELGDAPLHGLARPTTIYSMLDMRALTMKAVNRVQAISPLMLQAVMEDLPTAWFEQGDRECLTAIRIALMHRQARLSSLVSRHLDAIHL